MISFQKRFNQFLNYIFIFLILFSCQSPKNNISQEKNKPNANLIALGKMFFFDTRLSQNNTKSCATCHAPEFAFTDGYRKSSGIFADETKRNAPTLLNSRYLKTLTWADNVRTYEAQMLKPLFGQSPPELGLDSTDKSIFKRFYQDSLYRFFCKINFKKTLKILIIKILSNQLLLMSRAW